jgi:hypothetical protein
MYDPTLPYWLVDSCIDRTLTVDCPALEAKASITAASWKTSDGRYTPWTVVDCSLLPAGKVFCNMRCLSQLEESPE